MHTWKRILLTAITLGFISVSAQAATEIQWWHAMGGVNGDRVNKIADDEGLGSSLR